ncbi:MAG: sensor histidine kinase KdpD [Planctomycetes bacterium]|nr:sensor histidine kinase KdpD [Planctomycetota bacterium]
MLAVAAAEAARARRGHLKVFFGAAPGVGKTYAMLESALARRREGVEVAIGWLETHGRQETANLAATLERLPPRTIDYRGIRLQEFDLDAALARRPKILIVDELAHTNAAGSRHARRWQDVEELLEAGIDVYSTLNVQHIESLNDVVAQITGVVVRETVPDGVFDRADEIELVDLPSDELLARLRAGKVYIPAQAERAAESFFKKGNLIALRELALRRAAERVDAQAAEWKREQGIREPWATRERLLVAVSGSKQGADVVRAAYRMAARLRAPWIALSVETPAYQHLREEDREALDAHLALAARLGAQTLVVRGERVVDEILAVAREREATRVIVGRERERRWLRFARRSLGEELVLRAEDVEVLVTSGELADEPAQRPPPRARHAKLSDYLFGLGIVIASSIVCWLTRDTFTLGDQAMIYLLGVLIVATRVTRLPALTAAFASVAALDFFFVPPVFTFTVSDLRYLITFCVMLIVALTVSTFTLRLRDQADAARQRERRTAALYAMSRQFVIETGVGEIGATAVAAVRELLDVGAVILIADKSGGLSPCGGAEGTLATSERELAVARWVFEHGRVAGHGTDTLPAGEGFWIPLVGTAGHLGVFGIELARRAAPPTPSQRQILETFVAQTALALERALLVERSARTQVAMETERTRSALLSAVSHDLRTPLASIQGSADVLADDSVELSAETRRELLATIRGESARLNRLVGDLLDLTKLESGALAARKEWYPLEEVVDSVLERLRNRLVGRPLLRELPDEVVLVPIDPILYGQVLENLLDNTAKYGEPGTQIEVRGAVDGYLAWLEVADRGPGIPAGAEEQVFERFFRAADGARAEGAGLGLAVARAIVKAHDGTIVARRRDGGGSVFRVEIPMGGRGLPPRPARMEPES